MAKYLKQIEIASRHELTPLQIVCPKCSGPFWIAYHTSRRVTTLQGMCHLSIKVRRCQNADCSFYHRPYRPEKEGQWALPHGEYGLDVIALVGTLRYTSLRSIPEIHQVWWYEELFVLSHLSLHVCTLLAERSFASLIQHDGVPCGAN